MHHLEASHDLFVYGFPNDPFNALRVVSVEPRDDIFTPSGQFQSLESEGLQDPVNKVTTGLRVFSKFKITSTDGINQSIQDA